MAREESFVNDSFETYLTPSDGVDSENPSITALSQRLTAGAGSPREAAVRLFDFVRDTIRYIPYAPFMRIDDYLGAATLERGYGFCTQKSALLVALSRAAGIPARFHFADLKNHNLPGRMGWVLGSDMMVYHTYMEFHLDGRWLKATPSFEKSLCVRMGWRLVAFDGTTDAILHHRDSSGAVHIEYVMDRGTNHAVPLTDMLETWYHEYGPAALERWESTLAENGHVASA